MAVQAFGGNDNVLRRPSLRVLGGSSAAPAAGGPDSVTVDPVASNKDQLAVVLPWDPTSAPGSEDQLLQQLHDLLARTASPAAPRAATPPPAPAPAAAAAVPGGTYTVQPGDSLWAISAKLLGDGGRWHETYHLNWATIGPNPNWIRAGQVLQLPGGASAPPSAPPVSHGHGNAPYINQYHPGGSPYHNGPSNCGPTSMAMVARAFGWHNDLNNAQLINKLGRIGGTTRAGTDLGGIVAMAHAIGISATRRTGGANTGWIASHLQAGQYVVADVDYFAEPGHGSGHSGHYILVTGMTADGRFTIQDPADGNERSFTASQLASAVNHQYGNVVAVG